MSLLNLGWLLAVAFLPFPTALIGHHLNAITGPIYLATLLVLNSFTLGMSILVHRSVGLPVGTAWLTTVVCAASLIVCFFDPGAALYLLLLIVVGGIQSRRLRRGVARHLQR